MDVLNQALFVLFLMLAYHYHQMGMAPHCQRARQKVEAALWLVAGILFFTLAHQLQQATPNLK